jgi:hypothetical protein
MQTNGRTVDWNEIQFLSWSEFRQMTPSILQLEVTRLGGIIEEIHDDTEFHNSLVRARFALQRFIACVKETRKDTLEDSCVEHLRAAIMNASIQPEGLDEHTRTTLAYVIDRLNYVHDRIRLIY